MRQLDCAVGWIVGSYDRSCRQICPRARVRVAAGDDESYLPKQLRLRVLIKVADPTGACKIFCVKIFYLMYQALKIKYIL